VSPYSIAGNDIKGKHTQCHEHKLLSKAVR